MTWKSILTDAVQISVGRRSQKANTVVQANPESTSRCDGAGGWSHHSSSEASQQPCKARIARAEEKLGELKNGLQIPVHWRSAGKPLACSEPGTLRKIQPDNDQSPDHVKR